MILTARYTLALKKHLSSVFPVLNMIALALIESGIIGNSIDRLWHGSVIDFFHVHYYDFYHYPIFNVADCAICTGVMIFIISNIFRPGGKKETPGGA